MSFYSSIRSLPQTLTNVEVSLVDLLRKVKSLMSQVSDLATKLTADNAALKTKLDTLLAWKATVPGLITQAVADAQAAGADPATLQSLTDISAAIEAETQDVSDGLDESGAVPPPSQPPVP